MRKGAKTIYRGWHLKTERRVNLIDTLTPDPRLWIYKYMQMDIPAYRNIRIKAMMNADNKSKAYFSKRIFIPSKQFKKGCWS